MAGSLYDAAQALLRHPLTLPDEDEAAQRLREMGLTEPTGADAVLLGQYLLAIGGNTAAAKYIRDAAMHAEAEETLTEPEDLSALSDEALIALAGKAEP